MEDLTIANGEAVHGKQIKENTTQLKNQQEESKPVVVVPLNDSQIKQLWDYNKHKDSPSENRNPPPQLTNEQLSSIPDRLENRLLTQDDKAQLLYKKTLGDLEKGEPTFHIDENNNIKRYSITGSETNSIHSEKTMNLKDVHFDSPKNDFPDKTLKMPLDQNNDSPELKFERKEEIELIQKAPELKLTTEALMGNDNHLTNNEIGYVERLHSDIEKSNDTIKVIPLSPEQIKESKDGVVNVTKEQIDSIPDEIHGIKVSPENKLELYNNLIDPKTLVIISDGPFNSPIFELSINEDNTIAKNVYLGFDKVPEGINNVLTNEATYNNGQTTILPDDTFKVLPLTKEQTQERIDNSEKIYVRKLSDEDKLDEKIYATHGESYGKYPLLDSKQLAEDMKHNNTTIQDYSVMETIVPDYKLTKEQINSIPDKINGFDITEPQKVALYNNDIHSGFGGIQLVKGSEAINLELDKATYQIYQEVHGDSLTLKDGVITKNEVEFKDQTESKTINKSVAEPIISTDQTYIAPINDATPVTVIPLSNEQKQTFNDINAKFTEQTVKPGSDPNEAVTIVPLTQLQKETYESINKNFDISENPNKTPQFISDNALNHQEAINAFAKTIAPNLASVPDHMDGQKLSQDDKLKLLTGTLSLSIDEQGNKNNYTLNEKNQIVRIPQFGEQKGLESLVAYKDTIGPENTLKTAVSAENSIVDGNNPASISTKTLKQDSIKDFLVVPNINIVTGNSVGESFLNSFNASFAKNPGTEHTITTESNAKIKDVGPQAEKILPNNSIISPTNGNDVIKIVQISNMSDNNKNGWKPTDIKWSSLETIGVTQKSLTESGDLDKLLSGQRTSLLQIKGSIGDVKVESSAKLRLVPDADGKPKLMIIGPSKELEIKNELFGHKFTEKEKEELKENKRLKEPIKLTDPKTKKTGDFYVGVDVELNKVVVIAKEAILQTKSLEQLNGVKLTPIQQDKILSGTDIKLDNKPGSPTITGKIDFSNNSFKITGTSSHAEKQTVDNSVKQEKSESKEIKQTKEKTAGVKIKM